MENKTYLPFGTWPSIITAGLISQRIRLDDVLWAADGETLVWTESRSSITALVAQTGSHGKRDLTDEQNVRGGVGYGGGSFTVSPYNDLIIFANRDGRLYRRSTGFGKPKPITPAINPSSAGVASPTISPDGRWVIYVYTDGQTDFLCLVDSSGQDWPVQLVRGADFYMQPAWHPDGKRIAWVEWNHPNMPWDGTRVQLGEVEGTPLRVNQVITIGGSDNSPSQQPIFSPDGRWLCFIEENGEWPDLILVDLRNKHRTVLISGDEFDLSLPAWVQGVRTMAWSHDSRLIYHIRFVGPNSSLWSVNIETGQCTLIPTGEFTALSQLTANPRGFGLAFLAAAPHLPHQLIRMDGEKLVTASNSLASTYDPSYFPPSRTISWDINADERANGIYYPPQNPQYTGTEAPPAILHVHGGPTSLTANSFIPEAAYFTSRGYAWIEVNYRGSTGYGRKYRQAMRNRWGDVDVEDSVLCAKALADQGLANPKQLVIMGGSAGGYTVLNALIRYPGLFKAGICLYGVTNLFTLDMDTHKFETHYNKSLVGALPEAAERYHAWSPVFHADKIRDALYIFQGSEDKVVPPGQAEEIVSALRARGVPHRYKLYQGEGHGFRSTETIVDYLKETERFLQQQVLFAP